MHGLDLAAALDREPWMTIQAAQVTEDLLLPAGAAAGLRAETGWDRVGLVARLTGRHPATPAETGLIEPPASGGSPWADPRAKRAVTVKGEVGALAVVVEDAQDLGRAAAGAERVRDHRGELRRLARLDQDGPLAQHQHDRPGQR